MGRQVSNPETHLELRFSMAVGLVALGAASAGLSFFLASIPFWAAPPPPAGPPPRVPGATKHSGANRQPRAALRNAAAPLWHPDIRGPEVPWVTVRPARPSPGRKRAAPPVQPCGAGGRIARQWQAGGVGSAVGRAVNHPPAPAPGSHPARRPAAKAARVRVAQDRVAAQPESLSRPAAPEPEPEPPTPLPAPRGAALYRIRLGRFETRSGAAGLCRALKQVPGIDPSVVIEDGTFRVQAGAYRSRPNAERPLDALRARGCDAELVEIDRRSPR